VREFYLIFVAENGAETLAKKSLLFPVHVAQTPDFLADSSRMLAPGIPC
jgi:hypothetical protein